MKLTRLVVHSSLIALTVALARLLLGDLREETTSKYSDALKDSLITLFGDSGSLINEFIIKQYNIVKAKQAGIDPGTSDGYNQLVKLWNPPGSALNETLTVNNIRVHVVEGVKRLEIGFAEIPPSN
ncbi:hypothetical protein ACFPOG_12265 [Paenibacillus aestuarii]|uniref:Uncharacterized protein n=1 Tax=Paenibacillus aestuarii TaxID=516965 RepID=A0ABW0K6P5_9BACL